MIHTRNRVIAEGSGTQIKDYHSSLDKIAVHLEESENYSDEMEEQAGEQIDTAHLCS